MAWDKGFNFRNTAGYVTDGANETYAIDENNGGIYPLTRNGVTFGWETGHATSTNSADRNSALDRRLAGINYVLNNGAPGWFRVDLPTPGAYTIRLSLGDTSNAHDNLYLQIVDTTTVLATVTVVAIVQAHYLDATGVDRSEANWPALNAALSVTFSTTILRLLVGNPANTAGVTPITHLFVSQVEVVTGPASIYQLFEA